MVTGSHVLIYTAIQSVLMWQLKVTKALDFINTHSKYFARYM